MIYCTFRWLYNCNYKDNILECMNPVDHQRRVRSTNGRTIRLSDDRSGWTDRQTDTDDGRTAAAGSAKDPEDPTTIIQKAKKLMSGRRQRTTVAHPVASRMGDRRDYIHSTVAGVTDSIFDGRGKAPTTTRPTKRKKEKELLLL